MKNILIKYLSLEAIENTVSSIKYKFDKVLFCVNKDIYDEEYSNVSDFIINECNCKDLELIYIDDKDVDEVTNDLETFINKNKDNKLYFDFTGANALFMSAAVIVSKKHNIPVHIVDIKKDYVNSIHISNDYEYSVNSLERNDVKLNVKKMIKMVGGCVVDSHDHSYKNKIYENLIELSDKYLNLWNQFCNYVNKCEISEDKKTYTISKNSFNTNDAISYNDFVKIIDDGVKKDIFNIISKDDSLVFEFVNDNYAPIVRDPGTILEQKTYMMYKKQADNCLMSVALDWDGVLKYYKDDLRNEIDVIYLNKYILTFVSCKNRNITKEDIYELESVARNFAGNYVRMKVVSPYLSSPDVKRRAKELGVILEKIN